MSLQAVSLSCPKCGRRYRLRLDVAKLSRVRKQAVCGRCSERFDVGQRLAVQRAAEAQQLAEMRDSSPELEPTGPETQAAARGPKPTPVPPAAPHRPMRSSANLPAVDVGDAQPKHRSMLPEPPPSVVPHVDPAQGAATPLEPSTRPLVSSSLWPVVEVAPNEGLADAPAAGQQAKPPAPQSPPTNSGGTPTLEFDEEELRSILGEYMPEVTSEEAPAAILTSWGQFAATDLGSIVGSPDPATDALVRLLHLVR